MRAHTAPLPERLARPHAKRRRALMLTSPRTLPNAPNVPNTLQVRAGTVVRATALVAACVVATTTAVSAYLGDIPFDVSPVPLISDTFVRAPASYVARAGVGAVACLLLVTTLVMRSFLRNFACEDGSRKDAALWRRVTDGHSSVGAAAALALSIVAAVNERENFTTHFAAASVFFVGTWVWHLCVLVQLCAHPQVTTSTSLKWKLGCVVASGVSLAFFFAMCGVSLARFYEPIAACEWLAAASIGGFTWSLGVELDGDCGDAERHGRRAVFPGSSREEASPSPGRGMSLGSVWWGRTPDEDQLLDVLVASESCTSAARDPRCA